MQVRDDVPASARRVPERVFADDAPAERMIDALRRGRLIFSDRGELRFAHDRLLTGWLRLKEQIAEEQRLLAARERLEQYCARWVEAERNSYWLEGFALAEGRELLAKWGSIGLERQATRIAGLCRHIRPPGEAQPAHHPGDRLVGRSRPCHLRGGVLASMATDSAGAEGNPGFALDRGVARLFARRKHRGRCRSRPSGIHVVADRAASLNFVVHAARASASPGVGRTIGPEQRGSGLDRRHDAGLRVGVAARLCALCGRRHARQQLDGAGAGATAAAKSDGAGSARNGGGSPDRGVRRRRSRARDANTRCLATIRQCDAARTGSPRGGGWRRR